jgi:hypothetical protein
MKPILNLENPRKIVKHGTVPDPVITGPALNPTNEFYANSGTNWKTWIAYFKI